MNKTTIKQITKMAQTRELFNSSSFLVDIFFFMLPWPPLGIFPGLSETLDRLWRWFWSFFSLSLALYLALWFSLRNSSFDFQVIAVCDFCWRTICSLLINLCELENEGNIWATVSNNVRQSPTNETRALPIGLRLCLNSIELEAQKPRCDILPSVSSPRNRITN